MSNESQAAATLLDKGMLGGRVTAPLLFRLFGKKTFAVIIKAPSAGTINRINDLYLSAGITNDELTTLDDMAAQLLYKKFGLVLCRIAAIAWLNGYLSGKLFGNIAGWWFYWKLPVPSLISIVRVLVMLSVKEGFMNTIRSVATIQMTAPNLSQINQGS